MADDKSGRDKQARDEEKRQRNREMLAELERMDEMKPPVADTELRELESELESLEFPATGAEIVEAVGDYEINEEHTTRELIPETDEEIYESPATVKVRVQRPTVAAAMKRVVEATATAPNVDLGNSQREAYEKTFRALRAIDADDDDEGIAFISDWIVERITEKEKPPGSRAVRREAAKFCREQGYSIRNDEWLGV